MNVRLVSLLVVSTPIGLAAKNVKNDLRVGHAFQSKLIYLYQKWYEHHVEIFCQVNSLDQVKITSSFCSEQQITQKGSNTLRKNSTFSQTLYKNGQVYEETLR